MRQKDFPKEVVVRNNVWDIKFVRKIPNYPSDLGQCDPGEKIIYIKQGQSYIERLDTFVHELIHAFEFEYNFGMPHPIVHRLGKYFARFLIDNT